MKLAVKGGGEGGEDDEDDDRLAFEYEEEALSDLRGAVVGIWVEAIGFGFGLEEEEEEEEGNESDEGGGD